MLAGRTSKDTNKGTVDKLLRKGYLPVFQNTHPELRGYSAQEQCKQSSVIYTRVARFWLCVQLSCTDAAYRSIDARQLFQEPVTRHFSHPGTTCQQLRDSRITTLQSTVHEPATNLNSSGRLDWLDPRQATLVARRGDYGCRWC